VCLALGSVSMAHAASVTLVISGEASDTDSTLYEDFPNGNNGGGGMIHVGNNGVGSARRAVLRFDVSAIPMGSTVTEATLRLTVEASGGTATNFDVFALEESWVEGSNVGFGSGLGEGASPEAGAVSWNSREHGTALWTAAGGTFPVAPSATAPAEDTGNQVWTDNTIGFGLVEDVQTWVDGAPNHGWIIIGDSTNVRTARRFTGTEGGAPIWPTLTVTYSPSSISSVGGWEIYR
jgi:hypothetical protein